jgi:UDP-glucose 4-epimerase
VSAAVPAAGDAFRDALCVVFGASGFLGSHVVAELIERGARVRCFDRIGPAAPPGDRVELIVGDILDASAVGDAVRGADHIFALAGGTGATPSLADPLAELESGLRAQVVLLEALRRVAPAASVVMPGSRLEYGRPHYLPVDEGHPLDGDSPYAIDRSAAAAYYRLYARQHGLHTVVLRLPNPYGPTVPGAGAGPSIVNRFVGIALGGGAIQMFGGGTQLRDVVYVHDFVGAALVASVTPAAAGHAINVGSGEGVSLRRVAEVVVAAAGSGSVDMDVPWPADYSAVETGDMYFDISLARELLGWQPETSLADGIARTVVSMREGR